MDSSQEAATSAAARAASKTAEKAVDTAVSAIGHAAGATVAPGTALAKLRAQATSPGLVAAAVAVVMAYLFGRRGRRQHVRSA